MRPLIRTSRPVRLALAGWMLLGLARCGGTQPVAATSCQQDSDCTLSRYSSDSCSSFGCCQRAPLRADVDAKLRQTCPPPPVCPAACTVGPSRAACTLGHCMAVY